MASIQLYRGYADQNNDNYAAFVYLDYTFSSNSTNRTWTLDTTLRLKVGKYLTIGAWSDTKKNSADLTGGGIGSTHNTEVTLATYSTSGNYNDAGTAPSVTVTWCWNVNSTFLTPTTVNLNGSQTLTGSAISAKTYTISYSKGSYSSLVNMPSNQTKTYGVNLTISSTTPYYDTSNVNGYILTWDTNGGSGGDGTTTMKNTTRTTLTNWASSNTGYSWAPGEAGFNENQNTIMTPKTFSAATVTSYGKLTALPSEPTRTNYTFLSWNTKEDGTGYTLGISSGYTLPYQPSANTTFYAIWKRNQASIKIKTGTDTWSDGLVWVKDSNETWQRVLKVYVKTDATTWTESSN